MMSDLSRMEKVQPRSSRCGRRSFIDGTPSLPAPEVCPVTLAELLAEPEA